MEYRTRSRKWAISECLTSWVPNESHLTANLPVWREMFENKFIVHFNHRALASFALSFVLWQLFCLTKIGFVSRNAILSVLSVFTAVGVQYAIGAHNVMMGNKKEIAHVHQVLS